MTKTTPYGVRRFASPGTRPDCFEVFVKATGECASFGGYKYEAEQSAAWLNAHAPHDGRCDTPTRWGLCGHFPAPTIVKNNRMVRVGPEEHATLLLAHRVEGALRRAGHYKIADSLLPEYLVRPDRAEEELTWARMMRPAEAEGIDAALAVMRETVAALTGLSADEHLAQLRTARAAEQAASVSA